MTKKGVEREGGRMEKSREKGKKREREREECMNTGMEEIMDYRKEEYRKI